MNPTSNLNPDGSKPIDRRRFIATSASAVGALALSSSLPAQSTGNPLGSTLCRFDGPDALSLGSGWESLNPGYWRIRDGALRRRLKNVGDRARRTGFPYHSMTAGKKMETEYDPSLAQGILYRTDWKLSGSYEIAARFVYRASRPEPEAGDDPAWQMYQPGYGYFGVAFGSRSLFESFNRVNRVNEAVWSDDGQLQLRFGKKSHAKKSGDSSPVGFELQPGEAVDMNLKVDAGPKESRIAISLTVGGRSVSLEESVPKAATEGYVGITGRGLIDFETTSVELRASDSSLRESGHSECLVCYPLGDTLVEKEGQWRVRFVALFDTDGEEAALRIADSPDPKGGWQTQPIAGAAAIVNNSFRRNTAVVEATLPVSPSERTLYYTVWKDGVDVTADSRIGTDAVGPGTGLVGDVPASGRYVGRLPRLTAPYKLCGLSCHALTSGLQQRTDRGYRILGGGDDWQFRDQPSEGSYRHLEAYDFQIMVWEDDVWYMELVLYPPSTDDAYKVVKNSIAGPTSRWQCMRHWNVINPGDHDYGMDDVKGPEQIAIRRVEGLGQDTEYMKRNFQIVHHLVTGAESVDPLANPKKWRAWKMPDRDFTLAILDSRLWRSSQDVDMWDDWGWDEFKGLYDRTDPTRSLLGEEQFAWLQELVATDSSKLMCLTGINGMHTVWTGAAYSAKHPQKFDQRDRVTADYAGWVKAGSDRVLELLGSRDGIVTVYGDVHNGCIMKNREHNIIECSFGPIGRSGGRAVIPGFGPRMRDVDGRELEVHALYHKTHSNPKLEPHSEGAPFYWNFLEMEFDPRPRDPAIGMRVRNLIDSPKEDPRGGGSLETMASHTGRMAKSSIQSFNTLPNADVRLARRSGKPVRGTRSDGSGRVQAIGLPDVDPGEILIATAWDGKRAKSSVLVSKKA